MSRLSKFWRLWAKSLGEKNGTTDKEADKVAILRTIVVLVNFFTCFVIVGWCNKALVMTGAYLELRADRWDRAYGNRRSICEVIPCKTTTGWLCNCKGQKNYLYWIQWYA